MSLTPSTASTSAHPALSWGHPVSSPGRSTMVQTAQYNWVGSSSSEAVKTEEAMSICIASFFFWKSLLLCLSKSFIDLFPAAQFSQFHCACERVERSNLHVVERSPDPMTDSRSEVMIRLDGIAPFNRTAHAEMPKTLQPFRFAPSRLV